MIDFGKGQTLREACPYLRDAEERAERIVDVAERNSVIEGLPPFRDETRRRLKDQLAANPSPQPGPAE